MGKCSSFDYLLYGSIAFESECKNSKPYKTYYRIYRVYYRKVESMQKEKITDRQSILLIVVFTIGSSLIIGIGTGAKNERWIATILGFIMVAPMILLYSRILSLFKEKDLFEILNICLGKVSGSVVCVLYTFYALYLGAAVARNFGEFVNIISLTQTPKIVSLLALGFACIFAVKMGIEVIGRSVVFLSAIIIITIIFVQFLTIPEIDLDRLKPFFANGLKPLLKGGYSAFTVPFAETVLFLGILSPLSTKKSPYKIYFTGISVATFIFVAIVIRNTGILGNMLDAFNFPSYEAISMISIGDFLQRIEVTVSIIFMCGVFIKCTICLLFACKGIRNLVNLSDYRTVAVQTGLIMAYLSLIIVDSSVEMQNLAFEIYPYFAIPFQILLPVVIWIFAEIKAKKLKN